MTFALVRTSNLTREYFCTDQRGHAVAASWNVHDAMKWATAEDAAFYRDLVFSENSRADWEVVKV